MTYILLLITYQAHIDYIQELQLVIEDKLYPGHV